MKKMIIALTVAVMLLVSIVPASAAEASPLATAKDGDMIYSFNFNGDSKYTPEFKKNFDECYTATPSADGKSITIKSKPGAETKEGIYGGIINGYTFAKTDKHNKYAFVYRIKTNGAANAKNLIGVGGYTKYFGGYTEVCGNYGNFSTDGSGEFAIFLNNLIIWKDNPSAGVTGFVKANELDDQLDVDSEGFLTMMNVYEGATDKYHTYALKKNGDLTKSEDWIYMQWANLGLKETNYLGFLVYVNSDSVDVTIKDARIYKGLKYPSTEEHGFGSNSSASGSTSGTASSSSSSSGNNNSAQTGDNMSVLLPIMLVTVIVCAGSVIAFRKTRKKSF